MASIASVSSTANALSTAIVRHTARRKRPPSPIARSVVRLGSSAAAKPWKRKTGARTSIVAANTVPAAMCDPGPPASTTSSGPPLTRIWSDAATTITGAPNRAA